MKKTIKRILFFLVVFFILIQFFHPEKNRSAGTGIKDISTKYTVPDDVQKILKTSCYDCHSNNTVYPWYAKVQPVDWWLNNHIQNGKKGLNFSEFAGYSIRKQYTRFKDIDDLVKKNEMPLTSYLIIHRYARLDSLQKSAIASWVKAARGSIEANYPRDSLIKKPDPT